MDLKIAHGPQLENLATVNVILGKNGCGKSTLLKNLDQIITQSGDNSAAKYITPERGGVLRYDPNVDNNVTNAGGWLQNTRRNNRFDQFRQQTMVLYRQLELLVLREIDLDRSKKERFSDTIESINALLENVKIEPRNADFRIVTRADGKEVSADQISSGESELIGLAIECLTYARDCKQRTSPGYLLLDEPDVHLHPDLQARLAELILKLSEDGKMRVLVATHSTALAAALATQATHFCFMQKRQSTLTFKPASECMRRVIPVFGAHPLSSIFNASRLLLVEGEDDVRIWQRAIRVSGGRLKLYPVETGGDGQLDRYERETAEIVSSIYDRPTAFSIRDGDNTPESTLSAVGPVKRFKLSCRAAENLLLTDDVLSILECPWSTVAERMEAWIASNPQHVHAEHMKAFRSGGFQRRIHNLKDIRNDLLAIIGTSKSWEDAVGIAIGRMRIVDTPSEHSLQRYLGADLCLTILNY